MTWAAAIYQGFGALIIAGLIIGGAALYDRRRSARR